jgi:NADPH-dependent ferric siderophore reductase
MPIGDVTHELVQRLYHLGETLPASLRTQFLEADRAVVPALIAILEQEMSDAGDDLGWAPIHAADLLGALGDTAAIPVLLRCLAWCDGLDVLYQHVVDALIVLGPPAIGSCLAAYAATNDDEVRNNLTDVLSHSLTHDDRIYEVLLETLARSPELGAIHLAEYGDPRAIPALSEAFDTLPVQDGDDTMLGNHVFIELRGAIEALGGELSAEQLAKAERVAESGQRFAARLEQAVHRIAARQRMSSPPPAAARTGTITRKQPKIGRNEPCWCGSGKKYKKCHLDRDR